MTDSKSFFEKLTGSVKIEEDAKLNETANAPGEIFPEDNSPEVIVAASSTLSRTRKEEKHIPIETDKFSSLVSDDEGDGQLTVDIFDNGDYIVIQSAVAGVDPENLDVSFHDGMVTVRGKRERMAETKEENYYYKELYWGTFSRSVVLPEEVDVEKTEAILKNGILTVRLPKRNKIRQQKIKVKVV